MTTASYPLPAGAIRQIPVLHLKYGHRILAELAARGPRSLDALFDEVGTEELFKGDQPHTAARQRASQLLRFARELGLVSGDGPFALTAQGGAYVQAGDPVDVWQTTPAQAVLLREQIAVSASGPGAQPLARGAVLALSLVASSGGDYTDEELGRALGHLSGMNRWRESKTFDSQGSRFRALLQDAGLLDAQRGPTEQGVALLAASGPAPHPNLREAAVASIEATAAQMSLDSGVSVWLIRAGRDGASEQLALSESVCVIGWSELGEIPTGTSRDELKVQIADVYGETRPASFASQAGQIYRFVNDIKIGDLVVLPLKNRAAHVAVGRVVGDYEHRTDGPFRDTDAQNTRRVEWLATHLGYERFDPDLREAFGQQGTLSEISKPDAAQRIIDVLNGADASAIHLVLKWSPTIRADTIDRHVEVVAERGAVWWGRQSKPGVTGLAENWVAKLEAQLENGSETLVFLYSAAGTWRSRLLDVTTTGETVDPELIPPYYKPDTFHSLWVKLTDFQKVDPAEITDGYVLAQSADPVTRGGLGNQTPLIIRKQSGNLPGKYFILSQAQTDLAYNDAEGERYHWTSKSSGASKQLANSPGARFVYYRPGAASDGTSKSYFGAGRISSILPEKTADGVPGFIATLTDYTPFEQPVPFASGPSANAQNSIKAISRVEYEKLIKQGGDREGSGELTLEKLHEATVRRGLTIEPAILAQLLAALDSGKHVILTGPPGTAKTTLAQAVAEAAQETGAASGYTLTTATADWTTYETIGGLRPTERNTLEFHEGHFLRAIRNNEWLVIDELNRSHFDRAFGQLFTVLSGQPVVLPYHRPSKKPTEPLVLLPEGMETPAPGADVLEIPQRWRIIATMNVFDKTLLFEMSFALMRRFAFIEVASPSDAVFRALVDREAAGERRPAALANDLLVLRELKDLGPAVFMDCAKFLRQRIALGSEEDGQLYFEAFYSYLLPQFEGIDAATGERLFTLVGGLMRNAARRERLRTVLNGVLGLELQGKTTVTPGEEFEDDEDDAVDEPGSP